MYACVDVGYSRQAARAASIAFERWQDAGSAQEFVRDIAEFEPYIPGQFYRRELPCLLAVLELLPERPSTIIVDGYVWLDEKGRRGLGAYLFEALGKNTAVIGVAKTRFATATGAIPVLRGASNRPLFVTAVGMDQQSAADCIRRMHGRNRIPSLLQRVDKLSRIRK